MRICVVSPEHSPWGGIGHETRRLVAMFGGAGHEVTLIQAGGGTPGADRPSPPAGVREVFAEVTPQLVEIAFACDPHRTSAAVMQAIEGGYEDGPGPDYLEVVDYHANGLVPLQARLSGHPLLRDTLIGVRLAATLEMVALNDGTLYQPGVELVAALEREQLRLADRLIWRGGDTLNLYRRYYADLELPEGVFIPPPFERPAPPVAERRDTDHPLKILFVGRLQRFKGALDLVEACLGLESDDWQLTMIGADTPTAPAGRSVEMTIEAMSGGDPRIVMEPPLPHDELQRRWAEHDLFVLPSTYEVWGNVVVEAMRAGVPALISPVGGPSGYVEHGVSGWHMDSFGPTAIRRALSHLLANRDEIERVRASGAVFEGFLRATDPEVSRRTYEELIEGTAGPQRQSLAPADQPLVTGVIPYYRSSQYVEEAVDSLLGQSHRNLEVLIINDGSFEDEDEILDRLALDPRVRVVTQLNAGEPSARNLGARLARGEYVVMLDSDNALEQDFVARALETFHHDQSLAYVTCWLHFVEPDGSDFESAGYAPLGNRVIEADSNDSNEANNWDGDAIALLPRRIFTELGYGYEPIAGMQSDWELYRHLREDGRFGAVIPECLARYRVHPDSLSKSYELAVHRRAWDETRTRRLKRAIRWTMERLG